MRKISLVGCFVLATLAVAQSQSVTMSPDETLVRETYAKLAYAVQLGAIHDALATTRNLTGDQLAKAIAPKEMTFKITTLSVGKIADIENRKYAEFVTPPGGWMLDISTGTFSYSEDGRPGYIVDVNANAAWKEVRDSADAQGWDRYTVKEALQGNHDTSTRYAALTVTVTYEGRSRTYNSLWFFGGAPSDPLPVDMIVGNPNLSSMSASDITPHTLLEAKIYASSPGVRAWLQTHQLPDAACTGKAACCLPSPGRCGVTASAASSSFAKFPLRAIPTPQANLDPNIVPLPLPVPMSVARSTELLYRTLLWG
jgi:hypothetical protein